MPTNELSLAQHFAQLGTYKPSDTRTRASCEDRSHCPGKMYTTRSPAQELIVVGLRKTLLLPNDDLLASMTIASAAAASVSVEGTQGLLHQNRQIAHRQRWQVH